MRERRDATAGRLVEHALARSVAQLRRWEPVAEAGTDPEGVHRVRVAVRRLRSDLRTFRPVLEPEWADALRASLDPLAATLGPARDADVLLARLRRRAAGLTPAEQLAAERVLERLAAERDDAHARLVAELRSTGHRERVERLEDAAARPSLRPRAARPARDVLPAALRRRWRRLEGAVRDAGDSPDDRTLHEIRILAKRCRYAVEAVAPVLGAPAAAFARSLARVQGALGEHQDTVVARQWLGKAAVDLPPPEAYAAGILAGLEAAAATAARARYARAWRAASRRGARVLP